MRDTASGRRAGLVSERILAPLLERFLGVAGYRFTALRGLRHRLFDEDESKPPVLEGVADLRDAAEAWQAAGDRRAASADARGPRSERRAKRTRRRTD